MAKLLPKIGLGSLKYLIPSLIVVIFLVVLPSFVDPETSYAVSFLYLAFLYISLALSWNFIGGYTGQFSLATAAFFGIGGYITAMSWLGGVVGYLDFRAFLMSGLGAALLGVVIGMPLLSRLRGDYFALGTLGLGEVLKTIMVNGGSVTGGTVGVYLPSKVYTSLMPYYYLSLIIALVAIITTYVVSRSKMGLSIISIREDEIAAGTSGVNVLRLKIITFALSGFFAGMCGSLETYYLFHIEPYSAFNLNYALYPVLMTIVGGAGTIVGPVIGASLITGIFEATGKWAAETHPLFSGALIVLVSLFVPNGIIGLIRKGRWVMFVQLRKKLR